MQVDLHSIIFLKKGLVHSEMYFAPHDVYSAITHFLRVMIAGDIDLRSVQTD